MNETFWTLLGNSAHWEFEIFLMILFDGVIGLIIWPQIKHLLKDHKQFHNEPTTIIKTTKDRKHIQDKRARNKLHRIHKGNTTRDN